MKPTLQQIAEACAKAWDTNVLMMKDKTRKRNVADCRKAFSIIAWEQTENSLGAIGRFIGGRDHSTVIHARDTGRDLIAQKDFEFMERMKDAKSNLRAQLPVGLVWG